MLYLNPKGIIPAAAIIKKGAKRDSSSIEKKRSDVNSFPVPDQLKVKDDDDDDSEGNFFLDKACLADMEG